MFRIATDSRVDRLGLGQWAVYAEWYGKERVVFSGDIFDCCQWVATQ